MLEIRKDIENRTFRSVYLLYGDDAYLTESLRKQLVFAIAGDDTMNFMSLSGKPDNIAALKDFTDTLPFLAEHRLVLLSDTGFFKSTDDRVIDWLTSLPVYSHVIFQETDVDKRSRTYKSVEKTGHAAELNHPRRDQAEKWVLAFLKRRGMNITREAYGFICDNLPEDMYAMESELTKICDYKEDCKEISLSDVRDIMTVLIENRIFEMTEAVSAHDRKKALKLYDDLIALKEAPMRILFLINRSLNQVYTAKKMSEENASRDEIIKALGIRPFVLNKLLSFGRKESSAALSKLVGFGLDLEMRVKSGDITDSAACELLIMTASK